MPVETPRTYVNLVFEPDPAPPRTHARLGVLAGVAAIAAVAVGGGFLLAPMIDDRRPALEEPILAPREPASPDGLDIVVDSQPPPAETLMAANDPGGILPPTESAPAENRPAARPVAPRPAPTVTRAPKAAQPPTTSTPVAPAAVPPPRIADSPVAQPYAAVPPPQMRRAGPSARPSFNCRYARTVSEQMACADPRLAAADRRLARAYHQAIRRGVPEPELRRQQDIWLGVRESAARYGPEAVARAYEERTAELQSMAR